MVNNFTLLVNNAFTRIKASCFGACRAAVSLASESLFLALAGVALPLQTLPILPYKTHPFGQFSLNAQNKFKHNF